MQSRPQSVTGIRFPGRFSLAASYGGQRRVCVSSAGAAAERRVSPLLFLTGFVTDKFSYQSINEPEEGIRGPRAVGRSRQDLEAAEPVRPVNLKVTAADRKHPPDRFALCHPDQRRIGEVHRQVAVFATRPPQGLEGCRPGLNCGVVVAGTVRWAETVAITKCYQ
jgi:hypothetical protein